MSRRYLIPRNKHLIKSSLFYWLAYTISTIIFTIIATILSYLGHSSSVCLFFALVFSFSTFLLIYYHYSSEIYTHNTKTKDDIIYSQEKGFPSINLVIGLGGMGTTVTRDIKRLITSIEATDSNSKNSFFLTVDTTPLINLPSLEQLDQDEYVYIGGYSIDSTLKNLDKHPAINEWFPIKPELKGFVHRGARANPTIGRLSLIVRYTEFKTRLELKLNAINAIVNRNADQRDPKVINVYIVCGLGGGTGTGIFLDVALKLRKELGDQAHITGVFILPSAYVSMLRSNILIQRVQANTHASLVRLDEYMDEERKNIIKFPGETTQEIDRPFDQIYFIDKRGAYNELEKFLHLTAQSLYDLINSDSKNKIVIDDFNLEEITSSSINPTSSLEKYRHPYNNLRKSGKVLHLDEAAETSY